MRPTPKTPPLAEYIALVALMISIVALATDLMLPALGIIGRDLSVVNPNDAQMVVSAFFLGLAAGQLVVGPLSDSFGRKPVIYAGYALFILGCILSMVTTSWPVMLLGRALQGLGASAPRVVTVALVRDSYEGRAMARIMSFVMAVFILVPALAPALGQGLVQLGGWRATFAGLIVPALIALTWFWLRMPETQPRRRRLPFSVTRIAAGLGQILRTRSAMGYTASAGLIFGAFLGYLSSAQQVFQVTLQVGERFPLYFGIAALAVGAASVFNSRLVMRLGMRRLSRGALIGLTALSVAFLAPLAAFDGVPPLPLFMAWQLSSFFCIGILFGNLTALSMEDLGHVAGLGAAFVGSLSTFMALPLGWAIGNGFDGTVFPLVIGFAVLGAAAIATVSWTGRTAATT